MLTLTFKSAKAHNMCADSYRKLARYKGGVRRWGLNNPFPLLDVLEVCGLEEVLWALRCCEPTDERDRVARLFACDCVDRVLPLYEGRQYPEDDHPLNNFITHLSAFNAVVVARRLAAGVATQEEMDDAWSESGDAAEDAQDPVWGSQSAARAARAAARAAAEAASDADAATKAATKVAETEWQISHLREIIS